MGGIHHVDAVEFALAESDERSAVAALERSLHDAWLPEAIELAAIRWHRLTHPDGARLISTGDLLRRTRPDLWPLWRSGPHIALLAGGISRPSENPRGLALGRAELHEIPPLGDSWRSGTPFSYFIERFGWCLAAHGHPKGLAALAAGALLEMASNAAEHAESPVAPVASFEVADRGWSFGVSDVGRGTLASLRENPAYAGVSSAEEALGFALQDGVSRFVTTGRGLGFHELFRAFADREGILRFRTGTAVGSWSGPTPTAHVITIQALPTTRPGFHVSVVGRSAEALSVSPGRS